MEAKETAVIDIDMYKSLQAMLNSNDAEDFETGMVIMSSLNFEDNIAAILLLRKMDPKGHYRKWKGRVETDIESLGIRMEHLNYNTIFYTLNSRGVSKDQMQLFMTVYAEDLKKTLEEMGYGFIKSAEINLVFKDDE